MDCIEPMNKKDFGIDIYKKLNETFGHKNYYELGEIQMIVKELSFREEYTCWALVAFMMPANVGEYFRTKGKSLNIIEMKKEFISAMTDGKRDTLSLPTNIVGEYDIEPGQLSHFLTHRSLTNYIAARAGYNIGHALVDLFDG
ncbi:MAG: hypothetical protein L3J43_00720 [Sulfurovum sp.]|nr:hypothetical protein [Sulfurovum sp.]